MEFYQLAYFCEVARQKHFTRAAERLNLAQPALSQQMHNLEAELGTPLFVRGRKQTLLTPAGEALLPCAEALLEQHEAAKQRVGEVAQLRGGRLIVATISVVNASLLPEAIRRFREQFPKVELVLVEKSSERVAELVESGSAELGFLQLPVKSSKRIEAQELVKEPFVMLALAGHAVAGQKTVRLAQCAREPFVFCTGRAGDTAFAACRAAGFEPRVVCESDEDEAIRLLVRAGLGLAIVPRVVARELPKGVVAVTLKEMCVERKLGLIFRRGHEWSVAAKQFATMLREAACR